MGAKNRTALKAVVTDAVGGAIAGGALALALRQHVSVESDLVRVGIAALAMLLPAYFLAILFSAKRTVDTLDASPHFDLLKETGFTEIAKGKVLGSVASAAVTLCCAFAALYTMSLWAAETVLFLAAFFVFFGCRALSALQIMGKTLRIYNTADRRLREIEDEQGP